jgi:hypothetical protein
MNFREVLMENHSLALMQSIKKYVGDDKKRFGELMKLSLEDKTIIAPRASWAAMHAGDKRQDLLNPWIEKMLKHLSQSIHSSVKRNFLRLFQEIVIPEKFRGELIEVCYKFVYSMQEPIAVRVFSLTVICNQVKLHPELKNELEIVVKDLMTPGAPPAIISRGKKILKTLSRIKISK